MGGRFSEPLLIGLAPLLGPNTEDELSLLIYSLRRHAQVTNMSNENLISFYNSAGKLKHHKPTIERYTHVATLG
eukprot:2004950-Pyramimonas_sp.AAC.1